MSEPTNKRPVGSAALESIMIEKKFRKLKIDESISYQELNESMPGLDVKTKHRGYAMTAIRRCESDGIFIRCVMNEGWVRVNDSKAVDLTDDSIKRTRRLLRRTSSTLARVDFESLDKDHQRKHQLNLAVAGTMALFAKSSSLRKIEDKMNGSTVKPSNDEILKLFQG